MINFPLGQNIPSSFPNQPINPNNDDLDQKDHSTQEKKNKTNSSMQRIAKLHLDNKAQKLNKIEKQFLKANPMDQPYQWTKLPNDLKYKRDIFLILLETRGNIYKNKNLPSKKQKKVYRQVNFRWRNLPRNLRNDKKVLLKYLETNSSEWLLLPNELKYDKEIVLSILGLSDFSLWDWKFECESYWNANLPSLGNNKLPEPWDELPQELKEDRDVVLRAVSIRGHIFKDVSIHFRQDPEIALAAVSSWGLAFEHVSEDLKKNRNILKQALLRTQLPTTHQHDPNRLDWSTTTELNLINVQGSVFQFAHQSLQEDEEMQKIAICQHGSAFKYAKEALRHNLKYVKIAVKTYPPAIQYTSPEIRGNLENIKELILRNWQILEYIDENLKRDRSLALLAIDRSGLALQYLDSFKNDKEIVFLAIQKNYEAWNYAAELLKYKEEFLEAAFTKNSKFITLIDCIDGKNFVLSKIAENPQLFFELNDFFKEDKETIIDILKIIKNTDLETRIIRSFLFNYNFNTDINFFIQLIKINHEVLFLYDIKTNNLLINEDFLIKLASHLSIFPFYQLFVEERRLEELLDLMKRNNDFAISACCCDPDLLPYYNFQNDLEALMHRLYIRFCELICLPNEKFLIKKWIELHQTHLIINSYNIDKVKRGYTDTKNKEKKCKKEKTSFIHNYKNRMIEIIKSNFDNEEKKYWINKLKAIDINSDFVAHPNSSVKNARSGETTSL